jgi:hypothetical protein
MNLIVLCLHSPQELMKRNGELLMRRIEPDISRSSGAAYEEV